MVYSSGESAPDEPNHKGVIPHLSPEHTCSNLLEALRKQSPEQVLSFSATCGKTALTPVSVLPDASVQPSGRALKAPSGAQPLCDQFVKAKWRLDTIEHISLQAIGICGPMMHEKLKEVTQKIEVKKAGQKFMR